MATKTITVCDNENCKREHTSSDNGRIVGWGILRLNLTKNVPESHSSVSGNETLLTKALTLCPACLVELPPLINELFTVLA